MPKRDTKELIRGAALKLFSDRGYDGVGVRDIAKEVGIRESALYKHYNSKQEIFDSVISNMENVYEREAASFQLPEEMMPVINGGEIQENLVKMCMLMFEIYLKDERGAQLRRMLSFEQIKDTEIGRFFTEKVVNDGLKHISEAFSGLIKSGYYRDLNPDTMALQFYAPFYLLLTKYDRQPDKYDEVLGLLQEHIRQFDLLHRK